MDEELKYVRAGNILFLTSLMTWDINPLRKVVLIVLTTMVIMNLVTVDGLH